MWWISNWRNLTSFRTVLREYIRRELGDGSEEASLPAPEMFEVESINVLWRDKPETSMVYFGYPGDDVRAWHVTFDGFEPQGFAYDD